MQSTYLNPQQYAGQPAALPGMGLSAVPGASPNTGYANGHSGMAPLPGAPTPTVLQPSAQPFLQPSVQPWGSTGTAGSGAPNGSPPMRTTSYIIPNVFGNGGAAGQAGQNNYLPTPCQAVPSACAEPSPAYKTASSFPINSLDPSADVPSPYMAAPWVYLAKPQAPQIPVQAPIQPQMPALPQQPWPAQQTQPKLPVQQPQMPPAPQPPQQPAAPQAQPPQQPQQPQAKTPTAPLEEGGLTDEIIRSLNKRLNDDNEATRADAAMELFKILDKDPTLSTRSPYNQYVNAFIEKIMKDPSAIVRAPGELALSSGLVKQPSQGTWQKLKQLEEQGSGLSGEAEIISKLLGGFQPNGTLQLGFEPKKGAMTKGPGLYEDEKIKTASGEDKNFNAPQGQAQGQEPGQAQPAAQLPQNPMPGQGEFAQAGQAGQPLQAANTAQPLPQGAAQPPYSAPATAAMPQASQGAQQATPYAQQPQQFGQQAGNRFNYLSQAQSPVMAGYGSLNPQVGQRLNVQEGYR